jgi:hypothetical protein
MRLLPDLKCYEGDLLQFKDTEGIYTIWRVLGSEDVCEITRFDKKDIPRRMERDRLADMLGIERADGTYLNLFWAIGDVYEHPITVIDLNPVIEEMMRKEALFKKKKPF